MPTEIWIFPTLSIRSLNGRFWFMGSRLTTSSLNHKQVWLEICSFSSYQWKFEHLKGLNLFLCNVHTILLLWNWVPLFAPKASQESPLLVTTPQRTSGICKYHIAIGSTHQSAKSSDIKSANHVSLILMLLLFWCANTSDTPSGTRLHCS
jgi:hypothetical protein